jgi:hypothetical protein
LCCFISLLLLKWLLKCFYHYVITRTEILSFWELHNFLLFNAEIVVKLSTVHVLDWWYFLYIAEWLVWYVFLHMKVWKDRPHGHRHGYKNLLADTGMKIYQFICWQMDIYSIQFKLDPLPFLRMYSNISICRQKKSTSVVAIHNHWSLMHDARSVLIGLRILAQRTTVTWTSWKSRRCAFELKQSLFFCFYINEALNPWTLQTAQRPNAEIQSVEAISSPRTV